MPVQISKQGMTKISQKQRAVMVGGKSSKWDDGMYGWWYVVLHHAVSRKTIFRVDIFVRPSLFFTIEASSSYKIIIFILTSLYF